MFPGLPHDQKYEHWQPTIGDGDSAAGVKGEDPGGEAPGEPAWAGRPHPGHDAAVGPGPAG